MQTADDNVTKHHQGTTAKYGIWQCGKHRTKDREDTGKDHDHSTGSNGKAVDNFCHSDQTNVLAERCDWHTAEKTGECTDETVAGDGAGGLF